MVRFVLCAAALGCASRLTAADPFQITETDDRIKLVGAALEASVRKMGYVSGVEGGSFRDVKTGFRDLGFGLHIVDWVMEPGSDEAYRDQLPGDLPYLFGIRDYFWAAIFGLSLTIAFFVVGTIAMYAWVVWLKGPEFMKRWGMPRFMITSFLFLNMLATLIKMLMRHLLNVKYVMETPWINI